MVTLLRDVIKKTALATLLAIGGCSSSQKVMLDNYDGLREIILCTGRPNTLRPDRTKSSLETLSSFYRFRYYIHLTPSDQKNQGSEIVTARITAQNSPDGGSESLIKDQLKVGSTFTFQGVTWQVLRIGRNGIAVQGNERCRTGFMHIKQIKPD